MGRLNSATVFMNHPFLRPLLGLCAVLLTAQAAAHPIPDVPVRSSFEEGGACRIQVEVDPRCFDLDPEIAPYLLHSVLKTMPEAERAALLAQAGEFMKRSVDFRFEPSGALTPEFKFEFTTHNAQPLTKDEDPVVMTGNWSGTVPTGSKGYQIYARPEGKLSVLFLNHLRGKEVARTNVLFPTEKSFVLDLVGNSHELPPEKPAGTGTGTGAVEGVDEGAKSLAGLFKQGFLQVVARGYDFILFVLAMFLLGRQSKALLAQVLVFVVAHTATFVMEVVQWFHVPAGITEAGAAAGILILALANVFYPRCTFFRLGFVALGGLYFGFNLGHAFSVFGLTPDVRVPGLAAYLAGVEVGVLTILAVALLLTFWARNATTFRRAVAVPGSIAVAVLGLWVMAGRVGWIGA